MNFKTIVVLAAISSAAFARAGTAQPGKPVEQVLAGCAACHGMDGRSRDDETPRLRAQNYDYLVNQITRFAALQPGPDEPVFRGLDTIRDRHSETMAQFASDLDLATARGLARHYASLPCETDVNPAKPPAPPEGAAWCNDCHDPKKARSITNVPILNAQNAGYLERQLLNFKLGAASIDRESVRLHHFMSRSLRTMSAARIREVAAYYAGQACAR